MVARARGKMKKGGVLDLEMSARTVLTDWVQGRIPYCTKPPEVRQSIHDETTIVAAWGKEFDLAAINTVAVIDEACVQLDEAFMALLDFGRLLAAVDLHGAPRPLARRGLGARHALCRGRGEREYGDGRGRGGRWGSCSGTGRRAQGRQGGIRAGDQGEQG